MSHKLILSKGGEEQVHEFGGIEEAFDAAEPWIREGYVARITDGQGVVKYTQKVVDDGIATYLGDTTAHAAGPGAPVAGQSPTAGPKKPWWRFW